MHVNILNTLLKQMKQLSCGTLYYTCVAIRVINNLRPSITFVQSEEVQKEHTITRYRFLYKSSLTGLQPQTESYFTADLWLVINVILLESTG